MDVIKEFIRFFPLNAETRWRVRSTSIHFSPFSTPGGSIAFVLVLSTIAGGLVGIGVAVFVEVDVRVGLGVFVGVGVGVKVGVGV